MFRKKLLLNLYGSMRSGNHSYLGIQLAAWSVIKEKFDQIYFPLTYLKLLITSILPLKQLRSAAG